jgi:hypothetical protein
MTKNYFTIDYWFDEEGSELHLTIYQGKKTVYTEDVVGDFENEEDKKLTCLEIAASHGFSPALFKDEPIKKAMSELGQRSVAARRKDPKKMEAWAKKINEARWGKKAS